MSGGAVTAVFGKLPAHGDFVRRGGPAALVARLDRWLEVELSAASVAADADAGLEPIVAAFACWRFAFEDAGRHVLLASVASEDAVGRSFPLLAATGCDAAPDFTDAERWCAEATRALAGVRDDGLPADAALLAVSAIPALRPGAPNAAGWWTAGSDAASGAPGLPIGEAFRALLAEAAA